MEKDEMLFEMLIITNDFNRKRIEINYSEDSESQ
jgi:hypothetical protein